LTILSSVEYGTSTMTLMLPTLDELSPYTLTFLWGLLTGIFLMLVAFLVLDGHATRHSRTHDHHGKSR
jgi:hypothetical protein